MSHVPIDLQKVNWQPFLLAQEGRGKTDTQYFQGTRYQRGYGFLGSVGRFLLPIVQNIATSAGSEAVQAGSKVLEDVAQGRSVQEAFKTHGTKGLQNMAEKLKQCGKGKRKTAKRKAAPAVSFAPPFELPAAGRRPRRYRDQLSEAI